MKYLKKAIRLLPLIFSLVVSGALFYIGIRYNDSFYFVLSAVIIFVNFYLIRLKISPTIEPIGSLVKKVSFGKRRKKLEFSISRVQLSRFLKQKLILALLFFFVAQFSFISLFSLPPVKNLKSVFGDYYLSQIKFLRYSLFPQLLFPFVGCLLLLILSKKLTKNIKGSIATSFKYSATTVVLFILGMILSLPVTIAAAVLQANIVAITIRTNPKGLKIFSNTKQIVEQLKNQNTSPEIIASGNNVERVVIKSLTFFGRKEGFYQKDIVGSLPGWTHLPFKLPNSSVILIGNKLIFKEINKDTIQEISPVVAKLFLKSYLVNKYIKGEPKVTVVSRQEYLKYRDDLINKDLEKIREIIAEVKKSLSAIASNIQKAKGNISMYEDYIRLNTQYRDEEYNYCISATWTYYGYYNNYTYRLYTDSYCQSQRNNRDKQNASYQEDVDYWKGQLSYQQRLYGEYKGYLDNFSNYEQFVEDSKKNTPNELGLFEPEDSIKIVLENISSKDLADFFSTLVHEFYHYASYVSEERALPLFFEEGLTEYLSRKTIEEQINMETNLGYPLITRIIQEFAKKIPREKLEEVYFNKDKDQLIILLDEAYGKDFYKNTELYFYVLPYYPVEIGLKYANNIMFKIGSNPISLEEVYSQESKLETE